MNLIVRIIFLILSVIFFLASIAANEDKRAVMDLTGGVILAIFVAEL